MLSASTGNDWLGLGSGAVLLKPKASDPLAPGTRVRLEVQVSLREGKGYRKRTTLYTSSTELIAGKGDSSTIVFRPGSQGAELRIDGARAVAPESFGRVYLAADLWRNAWSVSSRPFRMEGGPHRSA